MTPSRHSPTASASKNQFTYDAYIKQKDIPEGTINEEKSAYVDLLLYSIQGYLGYHWEKLKSETVLTVRFDSYENMINAVKSHNSRHANVKLRPSRYYKYDGDYVSSRDFKLIGVPTECGTDDIEKAIRKCTKQSGFTIRKRDNSNTVYVTFYSANSTAIVKDIWAIPIQGTLYRFMPAYYVKKHINARRRFTAKFVGFPLGLSASSFLEIIDGLHGKNAYRSTTSSTSDVDATTANNGNPMARDEILVEFDSEVNLNLACTRTTWYKEHRIIGLPQDIEWDRREQWLRPSPPHSKTMSPSPKQEATTEKAQKSSLPSPDVLPNQPPVFASRSKRAHNTRCNRTRMVHKHIINDFSRTCATGANRTPVSNKRSKRLFHRRPAHAPNQQHQPTITRKGDAIVC